MHMQGEPRTMQADPRYDDVVDDVTRLPRGARRRSRSPRASPPERIQLDPGIGFGKTLAHNLTLLRRLDEIVALGLPGRRRRVAQVVPRRAHRARVAADRVAATVAANVLAYERGARVFRVHDVAADGRCA